MAKKPDTTKPGVPGGGGTPGGGGPGGRTGGGRGGRDGGRGGGGTGNKIWKKIITICLGHLLLTILFFYFSLIFI